MERIVFNDGTIFYCPEQPKAPVQPYPDRNREWRRICVCGELASVKEKFVDGALYAHEWDSLNGEETEIIREDLSAFSLAGDLVDTRDGNITLWMGKPTELELTQAALDELLFWELGGMQI